MEGDLVVNGRLTIPREAIDYRFSRSGGPGGQNVNKLETRVEALFDLAGSPLLTDEEKDRARARLGAHLDERGVLRVVVSDTRSQLQNKELAAMRLVELLRRALTVSKRRRSTRVPAGAKAERLDEKRRRGWLKGMRREPERESSVD